MLKVLPQLTLFSYEYFFSVKVQHLRLTIIFYLLSFIFYLLSFIFSSMKDLSSGTKNKIIIRLHINIAVEYIIAFKKPLIISTS